MLATLPSIFCPRCTELILDAPRCSHCDWVRPVESGEVGQAAWASPLALDGQFGGPRARPACIPALVENIACVGTENGMLYAIVAASGELLWQKPLGGGRVAHSVCAYEGMFLVPVADVRPPHIANNGKVACYSPEGDLLWEHAVDNFNISGVAAADTRAYFCTANRVFRCLDLNTRRERWAINLPQWNPSAPLVVGDKIYLTSGLSIASDGYVACLSADDGRELWRAALQEMCHYTPAFVDGRLFVVTGDRTLTALDAGTGKALWSHAGDRGLSSPAVAGHGQVYVGAKDRDPAGERVYALHALDAATGKLLWQQPMGGDRSHIQMPPVAVDGVVVCGTEDGWVRAFSPQGNRLWEYSTGKRDQHIRTHLLVADGLVLTGTRAGVVHAIRWRLPEQGREWPKPDELLARGLRAEAAVSLALQGQFAEAAGLFAKDKQDWPRAIALYLRANLPVEAGRLYETDNAWEEALKAYAQAGDSIAVARCLIQLRDPLGAARAYEQAGMIREAAGQFEIGQDRVNALRLYRKLGDRDKVKELADNPQQWIDDLIERGEKLEAAHEYMKINAHALAAALYEEMGMEAEQFSALLAEAESTGTWSKIPELARNRGEFAIEAKARLKLGQPKRAAEAFHRAAEQAVSRRAGDVDEANIASLYRQAMEHYRIIGNYEQRAYCNEKVIRYAQLPYITVEGQPDEVFREGRGSKVTFIITNQGYSEAYDIRFQVKGVFELSHVKSDGLALIDGHRHVHDVYIKPLAGYVGRYPLTIVVSYSSRDGEPFEHEREYPVDILGKDESSQGAAPQYFYITGDYNARKIEGHEIHGQAQVQFGDRVEVRRVGTEDTGEFRVWSEPGYSGGRARGESRRVKVKTERCPQCDLRVKAEDSYCKGCGYKLKRGTR